MPPGTPELPVAIVGSGACGLTAAIALRDAGIDCVLLERDARPQGSTALSSGFIPAAGTRVQQAAGVHDDSAERFAKDIQAKAHGTAAPHLVAAFTEAIAPAMDALQQRHGLGFELLDGFLYPGHSVLRMHTLPQRTGAALVAALRGRGRAGRCAADGRMRWCASCGAMTVSACSASAIERPDGRIEHLACRVLLLACNGFGGNAAMVRELAARDARRGLRRPCRQRRQRHRLGPAARRRPGRPGRLPGPRLLGRAAGRADHLGADDGRRHPGQCRGPALPRRDRRLFRSLGAGAGAAGRHRLEPVRRAAAGAGPQLPRLRRRRGGRRGAPCRRRGRRWPR